MSFTPSQLKQSASTTTDSLSKPLDSLSHAHTNDLDADTHFRKNDKNNTSGRSGSSNHRQVRGSGKTHRLNSLPTLDTNGAKFDGLSASFDDNDNEFNMTKTHRDLKSSVDFIDDPVNDLDNQNDLDPDYFPAFGEKNTSLHKDTDDMTNYYESSGSFDDEEQSRTEKNVKKRAPPPTFTKTTYADLGNAK